MILALLETTRPVLAPFHPATVTQLIGKLPEVRLRSKLLQLTDGDLIPLEVGVECTGVTRNPTTTQRCSSTQNLCSILHFILSASVKSAQPFPALV